MGVTVSFSYDEVYQILAEEAKKRLHILDGEAKFVSGAFFDSDGDECDVVERVEIEFEQVKQEV